MQQCSNANATEKPTLPWRPKSTRVSLVECPQLKVLQVQKLII